MASPPDTSTSIARVVDPETGAYRFTVTVRGKPLGSFDTMEQVAGRLRELATAIELGTS